MTTTNHKSTTAGEKIGLLIIWLFSASCEKTCSDGSGCLSPEQVCDFFRDCTDSSDEFGCPTLFDFDHCEETTGSNTCNWEEDPVDAWDWKLVTGDIFAHSLPILPMFFRGGDEPSCVARREVPLHVPRRRHGSRG